jgi:hypothetical protein
MSSYLKGNYRLKRNKATLSPKGSGNQAHETPEQEFQRRALERLGGSIAFVVKPNLVWNGENAAEPGESTS